MARLVIRKGNNKGEVIPLTPTMTPKVFGRLLDCDYTLFDNLVSRRHFQIFYEGEAYVVIDLDSHNGTYHNGRRMTDKIPLHPGDRIQAGMTLLSFDEDESDEMGEMIGKKIGPYRCIRRLGVGGMGDVYLAQQLTLGRQVALKILFPDRIEEESQTRRFILEARNAGKLDHPNVIHVYDVGEVNGLYYYSMELVTGGSVEDLIAGGKRLTPLEAVIILLEAARALYYSEQVGVIHCDVKPANLMLTEDGHIRLADLGISKTTNAMGKADQTDGVYGSPHYMSPEQCKGEDLDHRTDQYSLGVVAYRVLSGQFPYDGTTAQGIMEKHVFDKLTELGKVSDDVPSILADIVNRMLEKNPDKRFPSFKDVVAALETAKRTLIRETSMPSHIVRANLSGLKRKKRARIPTITWIMMAATILLGAFWYYSYRHKTAQKKKAGNETQQQIEDQAPAVEQDADK